MPHLLHSLPHTQCYNRQQSLFTWRRLQVIQGQGLWVEGKVFAGLLEAG